eukprot:SAG31_NODE_264_length_18835_cov_7.543553_14_plen_142_part_00
MAGIRCACSTGRASWYSQRGRADVHMDKNRLRWCDIWRSLPHPADRDLVATTRCDTCYGFESMADGASKKYRHCYASSVRSFDAGAGDIGISAISAEPLTELSLEFKSRAAAVVANGTSGGSRLRHPIFLGYVCLSVVLFM